MKQWRRYVPAGIAAFIMIAALMMTFSVKAEEKDASVIPDRVYFGTISGGGLTEDEALETIEAYVQQLGETSITLSAGDHSVTTTAGEMGLSWSNPEIVEEAAGLGKSGNLIVRYKAKKDLEHEDKVYEICLNVDAASITQILENSLEELNEAAVDSDLKLTDGEFVIIPGVTGISVNVQESVKAIEEYFASLWNRTECEINLVADIVEPRGTQEELSRVKDVLGSFSTDFSKSSEGRIANIQVGTGKINGTLLYPGDQLSVYELTAPFVPEEGYQLAGAYENGQTVESYGGGMCQVSTTLYNAAIRAELEITERFAHSMTVSYVDPSADAAIAGTWKDLKFVNNTDSPIYVEGYTYGKTLCFKIYGHETRDANRVVSFESETIESTDPGAVFKAAGDLPIGTIKKEQGVHLGIKARLWKVVTVDGNEVSREVFNNSTYSPSQAVYNVGVASANAEAVAAMNAALETKDEATIRAAAAEWNDEAQALKQQQEQQQQEQQAAENPGAADPGTADPGATEPGAAEPGDNTPEGTEGGNN